MSISKKYYKDIKQDESLKLNEEDVVFSSEIDKTILFTDGSYLFTEKNEMKSQESKIHTVIDIKKIKAGENILHIKIPRIPGHEIIGDDTSYRHIFIDEKLNGYTQIIDDIFNEKEYITETESNLYLQRIGIKKEFIKNGIKELNKKDLMIVNNISNILEKKIKKGKRLKR